MAGSKRIEDRFASSSVLHTLCSLYLHIWATAIVVAAAGFIFWCPLRQKCVVYMPLGLWLQLVTLQHACWCLR